MVLKNLFKGKKAPENLGNSEGDPTKGVNIVNKLYLQLPELEGEPTYELENTLTFGSEIGDVIIEDDGISPKHCTFTHSQDVISVMDHGSQQGTFINKKRIEPGRIFILQDSDKIKLGDLILKIVHQSIEVPFDVPQVEDDESSEPPELSLSATPEEVVAEDAPEEPVESVESADLQLDGNEDTGNLNLDDIQLDEDLDEEIEPLEEIEESVIEDIPQEKKKKEEPKLSDDEVEAFVAKLSDEEKSQIIIRAPKELQDRDFDWGDKIEDLSPEEIDERTRRILKASGGKKLLKGNKTFVRPASSTLTRFFGLFIEVVIIIIGLHYLGQNKEVKSIFDTYPLKIWEFIKLQFSTHLKVHYDTFLKIHVDKILNDVPAIEKMFSELLGQIEKHPQVLMGIYLYICIRLVTPLIFGVSLGQAMVGIRALGNFALKRILGVLRELIGFLTFAFLVFDLPALLSKRTFKEMVSFTHLVSGSILKTFLLTIFWIFLFIVGYILSPIIERGEIPAPIQVKPTASLDIEPILESNNNFISGDLKIVGEIPEKNLIFPVFVIKKTENKKFIQIVYHIVNIDTGDDVTLTRKKEISLSDLLKVGVEGNFLAPWKYSEILKITHNVADENKNFKQGRIEVNKLAPEVEYLMQGAFSMSLETLHEHILHHGPFLNSYLSFRENLLSFVDGSVDSLGIDVIGQSPFIIFNLSGGRTINILTLDQHKALMYEISMKKKSDIYLSLLAKLKFAQELPVDQPRNMDILNFMDQLLTDKNLNKQKFQKLYEFIFNFAKESFATNDKFIKTYLENSIASIVQYLDILENSDKDKFYQNLSDMLKAIKDDDQAYFGIKSVKTVSR